MWGAVELSDVHYVAFVLEYSSLVVVYIKIVRRREDRHDRREPRCFGFPIHSVAGSCNETLLTCL